MNILGISAFYHDSAASLIVDGDILCAAQEERFSRKKHDSSFPSQAVQYCLGQAGISASELDHIVFYEKPLLKFERLLETYIAYAPRGFRQFSMALPIWLKHKLHLPREMDKALGHKYKGRYVFCEHHESHAASAFFPSPFDEAAILTLDGVGEWATASYGTGSGNHIAISHEMSFPHSIGLLYSAFTYFTGFRVNSGEYKLMGLAPYGEPRYKETILRHLVDVKEDGSIWLDMSYFPYCHDVVMVNRKFAKLFGGPARKPEEKITQREMDIASSIQAVTEEIMLKMARHVYKSTGMKNLVLAGGVALNCVGNGRILRESPFENIWIQPAAGDAGGALGAAMFVWHQLLENPREVVSGSDLQKGSFLGPSFENSQIKEFLESVGASYHSYSDDELPVVVADLIESEHVIGWFQGRMEFGPRALGHRSIIGDARNEKMQSVMNLKIKFRESFRPFAPSVLFDHVEEYFEMRECEDSPYMLLVSRVNSDKRCSSAQDLDGLEKLNSKRSSIPAVTHVDYSARVQTVDPERHPRFYKLIEAFRKKTGSSVVINTSFNIRGEPMVCTPEDAYRCFMGTKMDVLVLENQVLFKTEQPQMDQKDMDRYKSQFKLD